MVDIQRIQNQRPWLDTVMKKRDMWALKAPFTGKRIASYAPLFSETEEAAPEKTAWKTRRHTSVLTFHLVEYDASQIPVILGI